MHRTPPKNARLVGSTLTRNIGATLLVRGTNFGLYTASSLTINAANLTFSTPPSTSNGLLIGPGAIGNASCPIMPFAIGDNTGTLGLGNGFVTYDSVNGYGLRLLSTGEYATANNTDLTSTYANQNVYKTGTTGNLLGNGNLTINSLFASGNLAGGNGSGYTLTLLSGALASSYTSAQKIGNGTSAITVAFGTTEAIITAIAAGVTVTVPTATKFTATAGNPSFTTAGAGTLTISSTSLLSNNFGVITVDQGTLQAGVTNMTNGVPLTVNGGTFDMNGKAVTIGVLNGNAAGKIDDSTTANVTLTVTDNNASGTYAGVITQSSTGKITLTKSTGTGTLTLTNTGSTYTGGTNISAGTISISNDASLGATTGNVTLSGGTLLVTGTTTSSRTIKLSSGSTINVGFGVSYTISNAMTGQPLTKVGAGTLVLSGNNTYSGGTAINSGKLLAINTTGSATGNGTVTVNSGGTLGGTGAVGAIRAQNGGVVSPGLSPGTLTATAADLTQGVTTGGNLYLEINDSGNDLLQLGSGTLTLDGTSVLTVDLNGLSAPPATEPVPVVAGNVTGFGSFNLTNLHVVNNVHNLVVTPTANSSGLFLQIKASTSTTVTSPANPSVFGQPVTFTAVVANTSGTGILPTGTVTFSDGSTSIGTGVVTSGTTATFSTSSLTVGNHTITVAYSGDSNFSGSTSRMLTQIVQPNTLFVTSFTPTSTGFTAVFSTPLNLGTAFTPILNLYDDSTGTLGPADITLVGATTGTIRGSLVVDQNNTRISFIETGQAGVLGSAAAGTLFGVLPNGTYTLTLRSANDGFQDTNGNLLDGNADGTPGDNYVTTFVVNNSSNSVTVTLPDFSRGAGQLVNVPNTAAANDTFTNGLPLRLYNGINFTGSTASGSPTVAVLTTSGLVAGDTVTGPGIPDDTTISTVDTDTDQITLSQSATATSAALADGGVVLNDSHGTQTITSVSLTLVYNPSLLNVTNYSITTSLGDPIDSSVTTFDTTSTAGLVKITFTTTTGILLSPGSAQTFLSLQSNVPSTAGYAEKEILDLQNIQINGGSITALDDDAVHVSGFLGDATGDGIYTGLDAQRISRVAVGLDPGFRQWVLADPLIVGDVSGDNVLTGLDALQIARQAVGITQSNIPVLPAVTPGIAGPDPMVSIGKVSGEWLVVSGESEGVVVPVNLDPGAYAPRLAGVDSVNLVISYDTSRVDVASAADVVRGSLTQSFDNFTVNIDRAAGIIYISGYRGLVSGGVVSGEWSGGSLALITFHVKPDAPAGPAIINLLENAGSARTALGGTDARGNDFLFDLEPRPSNVAGDALDGRINVLPANQEETGFLATPITKIIDNLGWASRVASVPEEESWASQSRLDDFFRRYPALVEDDGVVDAQRMQVDNDLMDTLWSGECAETIEIRGSFG